ncbi:putative monooxygenase family protein [Actinobacillus pleuropneumoniae]|nr:putative monooxygenase family protein [Actinobacillus pleuropneumoniae]KIE98316.1 putative monooxygenase family protein [Actinobacillus pleuropneumoniae]
MKSADIVIIGGGMVGLAFAALLKNTESQIKIIEKQVPQTTKTFSNRVSAINATSEKMLEQVGALQLIQTERLSPYQKISVWEQDSFAHIEFDNSDPSIRQLSLSQLGFIIENNQIQSALWQQVSDKIM